MKTTQGQYITKKFLQYTKDLTGIIQKDFPNFSKNEFMLSQITKINEEVGELSGEVLASVGYQRAEKLQKHSKDTLASEFADVFITGLLLAQTCDIDINSALEKKMKVLEQRYKK